MLVGAAPVHQHERALGLARRRADRVDELGHAVVFAARVGQRRQRPLELLAARLVLRRQLQRLAERLQRLVVLEADVAAGELEEDAAGLAEVDGVEVLAVDDLGRARAGRDGLGADGLELCVVGGRPRDVVDRPGAGDAARGGRGVVAQRRPARVAAQRPVGAAVVGEADRLEQRGARLGARRVGAHAVEAEQGVLGRDVVGARGQRRVVDGRRPAARGAGPRSRRTRARRRRRARSRRPRRPGARPRSRAPRRRRRATGSCGPCRRRPRPAAPPGTRRRSGSSPACRARRRSRGGRRRAGRS